MRRCVWSRNIKNGCSIYIYIYDISTLRVNLAWNIANLSILREPFYKFALYVKILSTSTPFSVNIIGICHVNIINICCHDSYNCHEWRNEWYWKYSVGSDLVRIGRLKYILTFVMGMNVSTVPANSSSKTVNSSRSMTVTELTAPWHYSKCRQTIPRLIQLEQSHSPLFCSVHCPCQHMAWVSTVSSYCWIPVHASVLY